MPGRDQISSVQVQFIALTAAFVAGVAAAVLRAAWRRREFARLGRRDLPGPEGR